MVLLQLLFLLLLALVVVVGCCPMKPFFLCPTPSAVHPPYCRTRYRHSLRAVSYVISYTTFVNIRGCALWMPSASADCFSLTNEVCQIVSVTVLCFRELQRKIHCCHWLLLTWHQYIFRLFWIVGPTFKVRTACKYCTHFSCCEGKNSHHWKVFFVSIRLEWSYVIAP